LYGTITTAAANVAAMIIAAGISSVGCNDHSRMYSARAIDAQMDYNQTISGVTKNSGEKHHSSFHTVYFCPSLVHPHFLAFTITPPPKRPQIQLTGSVGVLHISHFTPTF